LIHRLICSAADCLDILKQTDPIVKFVFDTGNFEAVNERAEYCAICLIEHAVHFYFKDFTPDDTPRGYHGTYFGQGMIKNQAIAQAINEAG